METKINRPRKRRGLSYWGKIIWREYLANEIPRQSNQLHFGFIISTEFAKMIAIGFDNSLP